MHESTPNGTRCYDGTQQKTPKRSNQTTPRKHRSRPQKRLRIQRQNDKGRRAHEHPSRRCNRVQRGPVVRQLWQRAPTRKQRTIHCS